MGYEDAARDVWIAKNEDYRSNFTKPFSQDCLWYTILKYAIDYGYKPWRALVSSGFVISLGYVLFAIGYRRGRISPTNQTGYRDVRPSPTTIKQHEANRPPRDQVKFNAFFYSLETFTPFLKLDQSTSWTPSSIFFRVYLYFHVTLGWALTLFVVGAITGLIKK